jgi:hypothetical protein
MAKEISALADHEFEAAYSKASEITEKVMKAEGDKMEKFMKHFQAETEACMNHFGGKLFR